MKAGKVRARAPQKPRCHLQSSQQVVQLVKLASSHVHCLSESSLTLLRLGPLFWKCKLMNKHPKLVICGVLLPWPTSTQTKNHINTSISWAIHNPFILDHFSQNGPRTVPPSGTNSSDCFPALSLSTSRLKESSSGHKQFLQPPQLL